MWGGVSDDGGRRWAEKKESASPAFKKLLNTVIPRDAASDWPKSTSRVAGRFRRSRKCGSHRHTETGDRLTRFGRTATRNSKGEARTAPIVNGPSISASNCK